MMRGARATAEPQNAQDRARQERLDVLSGVRGDDADHALRRRDLQGDIADLIQKMIVAELNKRGL